MFVSIILLMQFQASDGTLEAGVNMNLSEILGSLKRD